MDSNRDTATWLKKLQGVLNDNQALPESKYLQLATINHKNQPEVRTVVFRGFLETTGSLLIHTDIRSKKIQDIAANNHAQICWYFSQSREQFRFTGSIQVITAQSKQQSLRLQHWQQLSESAKQSYFWDTPGEILALDDEFQSHANQSNPTQPMSDNFCVLLFSVTEVDHLQLKPTPHIRNRFVFNRHGWQAYKVNP
ncbi:pyridoxamine 5'-phosphate oxidase family protein [Aliiglaciecola sp. 3_MG-2023]|uniref:pyridoxamine 5'-phosphate oxidase family protein n=1 Tax=Aliiglaciecola sp. 3_MG-2023 TaxID=3062644 RepID=UPI0026E258F2|nr:pyridoxamine 5'-phosphate oxidase family protein [Aliiglaciecola sp. 3_MG-2023]MDO6692160.1 pyridoxamine 5'-phosphate oxidase family protein [Aliiglaciecola sp. 3_MG-2023]